jgi:predicted nucleic acid-binding protein
MKDDYRIYMDCCCINRPFNDINNPVVLLEGRAVIIITSKCFSGDWALIGSEVLEHEINKTLDEIKKEKMLNIHSWVKDKIMLNDDIERRADNLIKQGIKVMDALHLACAEYAKVDVLLTTDISFRKKAILISSVKIDNPVTWLMEGRND